MGNSHSTNFTRCGLDYMNNNSLIAKYGYNGPVVGISYNKSTQITNQGCKELCGNRSQYYPWETISSTITTWILPVIGILLQAPFESNAFWRTLFAIARWVGSPIASLSYVLWNIKVSGKCAMIVDMAIKYEDDIPGPNSDFASMRDSLYILMIMNQFQMKPEVSLRKEAEGLLRIVLFSKDLQLSRRNQTNEMDERNGTRDPTKKDETLNEVRQRYAKDLRTGRRRGVVPVFISTLWFLFALAISIEMAFKDKNEARNAHDLALGLLLAWLPVLILCGIVDRNPTTSESTRRKLNKLVDKVRIALMDEELRDAYIETFNNQKKFEKLKAWVVAISGQAKHMDDFFTDFAGQGRVRWHYGAAHSILSDIEQCYIGKYGRDWFCNGDEAREAEARCKLVLGKTNRGPLWFDPREFWQISAAFLIVFGSTLGAFILSFFTPTVGLGCRSAGYSIFTAAAIVLVICEMLVWRLTSTASLTASPSALADNPLAELSFADVPWYAWWIPLLSKAQSGIQSCYMKIEKCTIKGISSLMSCFLPGSRQRYEANMNSLVMKWRFYTVRQWAEHCFFRPLEVLNTSWLLCIVLGQTLGVYQTCNCLSSSWSLKHPYVDFTQWYTTNSRWTKWYWITGIVIASTTMGLAMIYIVVEWCVQSHLSTENYDRARRGLIRTRSFRSMTGLLYTPFSSFTNLLKLIARYRRGSVLSKSAGQRSLRWTKSVTYRPGRTRSKPGSTSSATEGLISAAARTPLQSHRSSDASSMTRLSNSNDPYFAV